MSIEERSALAIAAMIRGRRVSAVEVVQAHLERIAERNPAINAIVAIADDALDQAATRDRELSRGRSIGPFHGVPFTAKDIIETADLPTTLGLPALAANRPSTDATVVRRMRQAGGILLGKTNCPPGGSGGDTANELHGRTWNPYDPALTPAGSSGGEAAAIASGMSPCGIGSDSGGSLRMPAHVCGIATLKPTAGRIPVSGLLDDDGPLGSLGDPRTQPGPMARSVDDLAAMLAVLAGPDGRDAGTAPVALVDPGTIQIRSLRVTVQVSDGVADPTADVERAVRDAGGALAEAGAVAVEKRLPPGGHELTERVWSVGGDDDTGADVYAVLREWDRYRTNMLGVLDEVDLILTPVAPHVAVPPGVDITWRYTTPHSLTGWPCVVVRAGSSGGLPIGVQVVAGPWHDHVALAAAGVIERALGGWRPPG